MALSQSEQILIDLNRQILQSTQQMAKNMSGVTNYTKQANEALGNVNRNSQSAEKTFNNINSEAENFGKELNKSNKESGKLKEAFKDIGNTIKSMTGLTSGFIAALGIGQTIMQVGELRQEFLKLSKNMAMGRGEMEQLSDSVLRVQTATGESLGKLQAMGTTLIKMRVSVKDFGALLKTTQEFARATGVSDAAASKLVGQLNRMGKMGNDSIRRVVGSIAQVQKTFGMTSDEAEGLTDSLLLATQRLKQIGSSSGQIEKFSKGTMKLAAAFSSVGVEAGEAAKIIDRLLDPGAIEDNALLFAKLGVGIGDAINGNIDPASLISGFKNLGKEMSSMTGPAAAALSRELGMSLTDIRQMSDMDPKAIAEKFGLASDASADLTKQANGNRDVMDNISQIWESIKGTIGSLVNAVMPLFVPLLEKINKTVKGLGTNIESNFIQNIKKGTLWLSNMIDKVLNGNGLDGFIEQVKKIPEMFQQAVKFFQNLPELIGKIGPMLGMLVPMLANIFGGGIKKAFSTNTDSIAQTMSDAVSTGYVKGIEKGNLIQSQKAKGGKITGGNQELSALSKTINTMNYDLFSAEKNSANLFGFSKKMAEQAERAHRAVMDSNKGFNNLSNIMTNIARKNAEDYDITVRNYESNIALGQEKKAQLILAQEDLTKRINAGEISSMTGKRLQSDLLVQIKMAEDFHRINETGMNNYTASMEKYMSKGFWKTQVDAAEAVKKSTEEELKIANSVVAESKKKLQLFDDQFTVSRAMLEIDLLMETDAKKQIEMKQMLITLDKERNVLSDALTRDKKIQEDADKASLEAATKLLKLKGKESSAEGGFKNNVLGVLNNFGEKFKGSLTSVGNSFKSIFTSGVKGFGNALKDGAKKVGGAMAKAAGPLMMLGMLLGPLLEPLQEPLQQFADAFREGLAPVMKALLPVVMVLLNQVLMPLVKSLLPPLLKVLSFLTKLLGTVIWTIGAAFGNEAIKKVGESMSNAADAMWNASEQMEISNKLLKERDDIISNVRQNIDTSLGTKNLTRVDGKITEGQALILFQDKKLVEALDLNRQELNKNTIAQQELVETKKMSDAANSFAGVLKEMTANNNNPFTKSNGVSNALLADKEMAMKQFQREFSGTALGDAIKSILEKSGIDAALESVRSSVLDNGYDTAASLGKIKLNTEEVVIQGLRDIAKKDETTGNAIFAKVWEKRIQEDAKKNGLLTGELSGPNAFENYRKMLISTGQLQVKENITTPTTATPGSTATSNNQAVYSSTGAGTIAEEQKRKSDDYYKKLIELQEVANGLAREQLAQTTQIRIDAIKDAAFTKEERERLINDIRSGALSGAGINDRIAAAI